MNAFTQNIIAETVDHLVAHYRNAPDLTVLAARAGYDPIHFQKIFKTHVGLSPKKLVQYMNMRHARALLEDGQSTLAAAHMAGLSGNGRLHDLFVRVEAATPGEVRKRGQGMCIAYGYHPTPVGELLIGKSDRGVCWLGFVIAEDKAAPLNRMRGYWPCATFLKDTDRTAAAARHILGIWQGRGSGPHKLKLDLQGTNFQIQVWRALLQIPVGATTTYKDLAKSLGRPTASRAVGNAVGANPVSLLIPCHRVIRASGLIDNYAWGSARKKLLLGMEQGLP